MVGTEPVTVGEGKVAAWRGLGFTAPAVALGDSKWDLPLLEIAGVGYLLRQEPRPTIWPTALKSRADAAPR